MISLLHLGPRCKREIIAFSLNKTIWCPFKTAIVTLVPARGVYYEFRQFAFIKLWHKGMTPFNEASFTCNRGYLTLVFFSFHENSQGSPTENLTLQLLDVIGKDAILRYRSTT